MNDRRTRMTIPTGLIAWTKYHIPPYSEDSKFQLESDVSRRHRVVAEVSSPNSHHLPASLPYLSILFALN